jgi:hypothetical protein
MIAFAARDNHTFILEPRGHAARIARMLRTLERHPSTPCDAVARIEVEAKRPEPQALHLDYRLTGKIADLLIPAAAKSERTDELWRHTCFEAFVRAQKGAEYLELNLAPSGRWAVYNFASYRKGMSPAYEIGAPMMDVETTPEHLTLRARLDLSGAAIVFLTSPWRLALSAVIEETNGHLSYWGLAHPPGKPDFHHSDCFAHELG